MDQELKEKILRFSNGKEPFSAYNHLEICDIEEGRSRVELHMAPESRNRWGQPHGGLLFALADVACGVALVTLRQESCVTVSAGMVRGWVSVSAAWDIARQPNPARLGGSGDGPRAAGQEARGRRERVAQGQLPRLTPDARPRLGLSRRCCSRPPWCRRDR